MGGDNDLILVGQVGKPHGLKGEVKVLPITDWPERFMEFRSLYIESDTDQGRWIKSEKVRFQGRQIILKLSGIESRNEAETLRGCLLKVATGACADLPEGFYHTFDLVGLTVKTVSGDVIGPLVDVIKMPAHDIYAVDHHGKEVLIPAVDAFVKAVDIPGGMILIQPIDGLITNNEI